MLPLSELHKFGKRLEEFPRWSLVALAARTCLREPQIVPGLPSGYLTRSTQNRELFKRLVLIHAAQTCAASGRAPDRVVFEDARRAVLTIRGETNRSILAFQQPQLFPDSVSHADWLMSACGRPDIADAKRDAIKALALIFGGARLLPTQKAILRDIQVLQRAARKHDWSDSTPVPSEFFATHLDFTPELSLVKDGISSLITSVSSDLVDFLTRNPNAMYGLSGRQFEEVLADVFGRRGYKVELTLATRDKGRDIVAISSGQKPVKLIVECKRYHPENKVGIEVVQRLYGVAVDGKASKGIIATTSYFTSDAKEFLRRHPKKLEPQDFPSLVKWLRDADQILVEKFLRD